MEATVEQDYSPACGEPVEMTEDDGVRGCELLRT